MPKPPKQEHVALIQDAVSKDHLVVLQHPENPRSTIHVWNTIKSTDEKTRARVKQANCVVYTYYTEYLKYVPANLSVIDRVRARELATSVNELYEYLNT